MSLRQKGRPNRGEDTILVSKGGPASLTSLFPSLKDSFSADTNDLNYASTSKATSPGKGHSQSHPSNSPLFQSISEIVEDKLDETLPLINTSMQKQLTVSTITHGDSSVETTTSSTGGGIVSVSLSVGDLHLPSFAGGYSSQCVNNAHANEDAFSLIANLNQNNPNPDVGVVQYYAVFDGHGGNRCAEFLKEHLHQCISQAPSYGMDLQKMLVEGLRVCEEKFFDMHPEDNSGSCVVVCILTNEKLLLANIGDCRALFCTKEGIISISTSDHRAVDPKEKERIEAAGGFVVRGRVFGLLAVSRSIGDRDYKSRDISGVVIAEPGFSIVDIASRDHEYLIMASDGVWDMLESEAASSIIRKCLFDEKIAPADAAKRLVDKAIKKGSRDDATAVVIKLNSTNPQAATAADQSNLNAEILIAQKLNRNASSTDQVLAASMKSNASLSSQTAPSPEIGTELEFESQTDHN